MKVNDKPMLAFQEHHFFAYYVNELSIHVLLSAVLYATPDLRKACK